MSPCQRYGKVLCDLAEFVLGIDGISHHQSLRDWFATACVARATASGSPR